MRKPGVAKDTQSGRHTVRRPRVGVAPQRQVIGWEVEQRNKLRLDMRRHGPLIRFEQRHVALRDPEPAGEVMLSPPFGLAGAAYVGAGHVDVSVEGRVIEDLIEYPQFDAER